MSQELRIHDEPCERFAAVTPDRGFEPCEYFVRRRLTALLGSSL